MTCGHNNITDKTGERLLLRDGDASLGQLLLEFGGALRNLPLQLGGRLRRSGLHAALRRVAAPVHVVVRVRPRDVEEGVGDVKGGDC